MSTGSFAPGAVHGVIRPPGSKSLTVRAMAAAAMAPGRSHLYGALEAEDTGAMVRVLEGFGVAVHSVGDPWSIDGGRLTAPSHPLDAGDSGLTARLAIAMAAQVHGHTTIDGSARLRERPMGPLIETIRSQGVHVSDTRLPVTVEGQGLWGGDMEVDSSMSSQFVTALMMVSPLNRNPTILRIVGDRVSEGYLDLTTGVMRRFGAEVTMTVTGYEIANTGYQAADVEIEPDVSAAVYPMVAAAITGGRVEVAGVRETSRQPDIAVADHLGAMGCRIDDGASGIMVEGPASLQPLDADLSALPDGAMALATACLFADGPSRLTGLGTLRHKESDRLQALEDGMERLGARVVVDDESMMITPGPLRAATLDPHGDHRVAMSLALVGLKVVGVEVTDPEVVDKTWPGYWEAMTILQG